MSHPAERDESLFDGCETVVSGRLISQRLAACPLEPRSCAAVVGDDGRLTLWLSTQTPHQDRDALAMSLGLDPADVRVVAPDVGGGFGAKLLAVEEILVSWLARRTGRPVRWTETRSENMVAMTHGRAAVLDFTIGGSRDGVVQAYRLRILQDVGAYPRIGAVLPGFTALMASGVYAIPKIETEFTCVVTNTTPIGPFRGAGRPEATQAIERAMDLFADEIGLDPAEVRRRNLFAADAFPADHRLRRTTTTAATTRRRSISRSRRPATRRSGTSSSAAARRPTRSRSASASASTSRSRTASSSPSSGPSRSRRKARPSSARARSRTGRGTRRRSR